MIIEVYARRLNSALAAELVEQLRSEGKHARQQDPRHFDERQIDRTAVLVYHDGTDPLVPWAYGKRGISCELIPSVPTRGHAESDTRYLLRNDEGFTVYGSDGRPLSAPQPTEAEAWAQADGVAPVPVDPAPLPPEVASLPPQDPADPSRALMDAAEPPTLSEEEELAQLQREIDALEELPAEGATE